MALSHPSRQSFDGDGNRLTLTGPGGASTDFAYDLSGRLIRDADASGGPISYTYDASGFVERRTNGRNQTRRYRYDAAGRVSQVEDPAGTIDYTYDAAGNVLTVSDATGTIRREYDALNRVIRYTDSQGHSIGYAYDAVGHLTRLTYPDGRSVAYTYDAADRLTRVSDWAGRITRYRYDANNRLVETERPNGTRLTYDYDRAGQLTEQRDLDAQGNLLYRVVYRYDAAGNIQEEQVTPPPTPLAQREQTYSYGPGNRLSSVNGVPVQFDADGNLTQGPLNSSPTTFVYDARNRLVQVGDTVYAYDAEDQRLSQTQQGQTTHYITNPHAPLSQVLQATQADGRVTYYVYGLGLMGEESDGAYRSYHYDYRGSTVALTDEAGHFTARFKYAPYGEVYTLGQTATPFRYNGRDGVMTDVSGLYYLRARYYQPEWRRFVNRDVLRGDISGSPSLNRFAYVGSSPINRIDPLGLAGEPPLQYMHSEQTIKSSASNYSSWAKESTQKIIDSLKPGGPEPLRVGPDGKIWDGNTRIKILEERGVDVNRLPRTPYRPSGLGGICGTALSIVPFVLQAIEEYKCDQDWKCRCARDPYCS